jgi:hypothetical protein
VAVNKEGMTLTLYRRHKRTCCNFGKRRGEKQRQCKCKFWVNGVLGGREIRLSLDTRDIKKASQKLHEWEAKERVVERDSAVTLADAWVSYLADLEARKLSHQSVGALAARAARGRCGECLEAGSGLEPETGRYKFRTDSQRAGQLNENTRERMAERVGFEPTVRFPVRSLSRRVLSTAQSPLRGYFSS